MSQVAYWVDCSEESINEVLKKYNSMNYKCVSSCCYYLNANNAACVLLIFEEEKRGL